MPPLKPRTNLAHHEVTNQPLPQERLDLLAADRLLHASLTRSAPDHLGNLGNLAERLGVPETVEAGRAASRHPPELRTHDAGGRRIDEVIFQPAWHDFLTLGLEAGYAAVPWTSDRGGHVAHAAMVYLFSQVEPGACCPMTMTYAAVPALETGTGFDAWINGCLSGSYDPASRPAPEKSGLTVGMAMTEKQGGSDVRANTTRAEPDGDGHRLFGHKFFCSAPMSDGFLTLAQLPEGLTCFLAPRWQPDGTRNAFHLVRLKDKLGNRSNASAEIEYQGAWAHLVGDPGRGIATILDMVHHTRLDTAMAPAGLMRRALAEVQWWTRNRAAFGKKLIDQPLMQAVLADLCLEWQAATLIGFRVAESFDRPKERAFSRLAVALAKYINNKRCPTFVAEAMECVGGSGYVEESPLPWLFRESPLNAIWEGTGNIIALDVLRTLHRMPEAAEAYFVELETALGADRYFDSAIASLREEITGTDEAGARRLAERMALLLQASLMLRHADPAIADAYIASRIEGDKGLSFGTLPSNADTARIVSLI